MIRSHRPRAQQVPGACTDSSCSVQALDSKMHGQSSVIRTPTRAERANVLVDPLVSQEFIVAWKRELLVFHDGGELNFSQGIGISTWLNYQNECFVFYLTPRVLEYAQSNVATQLDRHL